MTATWKQVDDAIKAMNDRHGEPPAFAVVGYSGVAFRALEWQYEVIDRGHFESDPDDPDDMGYWFDDDDEQPTGKVRCHMVGDDRSFYIDPDDMTVLGEREFCHSCGQIGCTCNIPEDE